VRWALVVGTSPYSRLARDNGAIYKKPGDSRPCFPQGPEDDCYYYVMRYISERSTDPGLLVLSSLAEGPKHGYAITQDVEEVAGVKLGPGTLYGALSRLEGKGLIEPMPAEDRRKPYRLTSEGSAALSEQLQMLGRVVNTGLSRLRFAGESA
jgi:DNA-binding PadR family transcriptional regulator